MEVVVKNLVKHFGKTTAVDDLSFSFASGNVFGFVGPNGAGKTTTIKILSTMLEPTSGDAFIDGHSVVEYPERARRRLGYMPDSLPAHSDMTVHDYIDFYARAAGINHKNRSSVVDGVEEFTNLLGIKQKFLKSLSKGMKQRVSLARALVHDPAVLILDEPAAGLDPRARIELRELLKILAGQGKAILISSHILSELSEICHGAVIVEQGRLLHAGSIEEIKSGSTGSTGHAVTVRMASNENEKLHKFVLQQPFIDKAIINPNNVQFEFNGTDRNAADLLKAMFESGMDICEFRHEKTDLEDIFMNLTRGGVQ